MKDLYARLGIKTDATAGEIAAAGQASPEAGDCARILANRAQREVYDRAYSTLKSIGVLRHHLGLDSGESWFLNQYPDFAPRARSAVARVKPAVAQPEATTSEAAQARTNQKSVSAAQGKSSSKLLPILVAVAVVTVIVVMVVLL